MAYSPTTWVDDVTPVSATKMNKIEQGLVSAHRDAIDGVATLTFTDVNGQTSQTQSMYIGLGHSRVDLMLRDAAQDDQKYVIAIHNGDTFFQPTSNAFIRSTSIFGTTFSDDTKIINAGTGVEVYLVQFIAVQKTDILAE